MIYTDGTIAINAGSPIVTGTGTQWKRTFTVWPRPAYQHRERYSTGQHDDPRGKQ